MNTLLNAGCVRERSIGWLLLLEYLSTIKEAVTSSNFSKVERPASFSWML